MVPPPRRPGKYGVTYRPTYDVGVALDDDSASFREGFELGRLYEVLRARQVRQLTQSLENANIPAMRRVAEKYKYDVLIQENVSGTPPERVVITLTATTERLQLPPPKGRKLVVIQGGKAGEKK